MHNVETVKELQTAVRPQAGYDRTLGVLRYVKEKDPTILTKTGFMVGLGETDEQIVRPDGRYSCHGLRHSDHWTVSPAVAKSTGRLTRYATPEDFARYKQLALRKGFRHVASAPLARSSYRAWEATGGRA